MVSSEIGGGVGDISVGSIVWVRRRNGSWWPGKILCPEEISSTLLTSPRSGTPVKLLGREDASIDWYNLEKSKRVKIFRCGDFDDCIERAEAIQGIPPKKREKYARREDAILHALELERQLLDKKYGKLGYSSNGRCKRSPDAVTSSGYLEHGGESLEKPISDQAHVTLGSYIEEKNVTEQYLYEAPVRDGNQLSGDDDSPDAIPRMRGLQEFGLITSPQARDELSGVAFRAKRSRYAYHMYDSGDSSNDNRIQTSRMEIQVSKFEESGRLANLVEDNLSGSTEDTETDCSETDSLESDSDDEMNALSDASASIELRPKYTRRIYEGHGSITSSDDFDMADDSSHLFPHDHVSMSKWHMKGKRNSGTDAEISGGYINVRNPNWSNRTRISRYGPKSSHNDIIDFDGCWEDFGRQQIGLRTMLVDVDLKVQANNYRRDVPIISLMSKLNGHAIIGHPIQIEALENGSSEKLLASAGYFLQETPTAALSPVWTTGRRTANSRVPRHLLSSSTLNGDNKQYGKFSRNSPKKIRALSSIGSEHKFQGHPRNAGNNSQVDGLIKTEFLPTTIACIPVNLVFSRLHAGFVCRHQ